MLFSLVLLLIPRTCFNAARSFRRQTDCYDQCKHKWHHVFSHTAVHSMSSLQLFHWWLTAKWQSWVCLFFLNKNPKYYNGIPCIENTTIKTKSNWNPDLSSSISIKRVRTYTKEGKAHMGIVTVMIDIWLRKVRKKGMIALQLWAAVFVSLLRQKLRTDTYRSSSVWD